MTTAKDFIAGVRREAGQRKRAILTDDQNEDIARCVAVIHLSYAKRVWLPARYRSVYIEQARIKAKHPRPIRVDDREGLIIFCAGVTCHGENRLVYSPEHDSGESCLWFETDAPLTLTDPEIT